MRHLLSLFLIATMFTFVAAEPVVLDASAQDDRPMVDSPQYKSWADHAIGSSVVAKSNAEAAGQKFNVETTLTLVKKSDESVTVDSNTVTIMADGTRMPPQIKSETIPSKVKKGFEYAPEDFNGKFEEAGTETVTIAGKSYECRIFNIEGSGEGAQIKGRMWACDRVPGTQAKGNFEMNMNGMKMTFDLIVTEINLK